MNRYWCLIFIGGLFEIAWVTGLKHAYNLITWTGTALAIYLSMDLLIRATKGLPVGTSYAVFTGMGTAGTVLVETFVFNHTLGLTKIFFISLLLIGVIGLKIITPEAGKEQGGRKDTWHG